MNSPLTIFIFVLSLVAMIAQWTKRRRIRRGSKPRRRFGGVGPGAIGAVYGMLSEDKRNAIELIVEDKAAAVDPERARDEDPQKTRLKTARIATAADINEIVRVTNLAYRVEDFFIDGDRTNATEIADRMADPHTRFLVVDVDSGNALAASVCLEIRDGRAYFGMLAVAPAHQHTGLGRVLIEAIEAECRRAGCESVDIDVVNLREELPAFYRTMGFSETGTAPFTKGHKLKQPAHLILMSKALV